MLNRSGAQFSEHSHPAKHSLSSGPSDVLLTSGGKNSKNTAHKLRHLNPHSAFVTHCGVFLFPCFRSLVCSTKRLDATPDPSGYNSVGHLCWPSRVRQASTPGVLSSLMTKKHGQQRNYSISHLLK